MPPPATDVILPKIVNSGPIADTNAPIFTIVLTCASDKLANHFVTFSIPSIIFDIYGINLFPIVIAKSFILFIAIVI